MKERISIFLVIIIFCSSVFVTMKKTEENIRSVISIQASDYNDKLIILDAGHGGEDGGAVAFDGTVEKDLNLLFTENIALYFDIFGISYIKVRDSDISVGDTSLGTIRERKISDIHTRYSLINSYENSVLLSIHQNMYSVEKYSGTQVFYSSGVSDSEIIAGIIQRRIHTGLQPENTRKIKESDKSIYLLYNAQRPSVMVECGFLSNINELSLLNTHEYRSQFSYFLTQSIIEYLIT